MRPEHVFVIAEGQLGDLLLLTPALHAIKETYPSAILSVLVVDRHATTGAPQTLPLPHLLRREANHVLAQNLSVDRLFVYHRSDIRALHGWRRLQAELGMVRWLRWQKADAVIVTFPEDRFVVWAFLSGAAVRIGQAEQPLAWLLTHRVDARKDQGGVLAYYCALAGVLGARCSATRTVYQLPPGAEERATELLERAGVPRKEHPLAVHPGASGDYKIWPPERYAGLIDRLREEGRCVVLLQGVQDGKVVEEITSALRYPVPLIDTGADLGLLAAIFQRAALCITNDSGPRHLAVAVGTPSLAFFRQHHDREWKVYDETRWCRTLKSTALCPACPTGECKDLTPAGEHFGSHCIRMITVEETLAAVHTMLGEE